MSQTGELDKQATHTQELGAATIDSVRIEFVRYKTLAERAFTQIPDEHLNKTLGEGTNSVSTIIRHLSGNLKSRYTDFLVSGVDGEKAWRHREREFIETKLSRAELLAIWEEGNTCFQSALDKLDPGSLLQTVKIRGADLSVDAALHRSLAHYSYHVGQLIMICRIFTGEKNWETLTVLTTDANRGATSNSAVRW